MKKQISIISLLTLLSLQAPVQAAWASKNRPDPKKDEITPPPNTPGFKLQDNRTWYIEADYLFWKPNLEDTSFALKGTGSTNSTTGAVVGKEKIKQPSFDLSSGARLGLGGYTNDSWDVGFRGTYLYSDAHKTIHAHPENNQIIAPQWFSSIFGTQGTKATADWRMNFYLLDFTIGREYFLTKRFSVHPFIGLRGAAIFFKDSSHFRSNFQSSSTSSFAVSDRFSAKQSIWGAGPRIGFDLNFYVACDWLFMGGLSGSLLYTNYRVSERFKGFYAPTTTTIAPFNLKGKQSSNFGRGNIDAYFGFGWSHWYNNGSTRVTIALSFEAQEWFNLNQLFSLESVTPTNRLDIHADKNHGDLSLIGGTLHFKIDF
jgi:hypothetical protein